jgi:hypothetical protein
MNSAASPVPADGSHGTGPRTVPDGPAGPLDAVRSALDRYLVLPDPHTGDAIALWIAATHLQVHFRHAPRLAITGPAKRCGKSRLLEVVTELVHQPLITVNASASAVFRSIRAEPPTLLIDEADTIFGGKTSEKNEELRGLLNAGHQRNRPTLRVNPKSMEPEEFPTFAMAALAGIGNLPDTIMDRAIIVRMRRRAAHEAITPFRSRDADRLQLLKHQLTAWTEAVSARAAVAEPEMPVEDRAADTWEPLVVVGDLAGEQWPERARAACQLMVSREAARPDEEDYAGRLLVDIHAAFAAAGTSELPTAALIARLCADEESPWPTYQGRGLTPRYLQMLLRDFDISSKNHRFPDGGQRKGFSRTQFQDAWTRYTPHVLTPQPGPGPSAGTQLSLPRPSANRMPPTPPPPPASGPRR